MISLFSGLLVILLLHITSTLWRLNRNYQAARLTGLPVVVCPYDPDGIIWSIVCVPLRPFVRYILPATVFAIVDLSIMGWEFHDKGIIHKRLGSAFILVTTGINRLICADPAMAQAIMTRRKDFIPPETTIKAMSFLGANIVTAHEDSWSRQRRIVAPALNERISSGVWKESVNQASSLADILLSASPPPHKGESEKTLFCLRTIAINVLTRIAYGDQKPFALPSSSRNLPTDMSYVDAISICTELLILAAFLPARVLSLPVMPHTVQRLATALELLPKLTADMLNQERRKRCSDVSVVSEPTITGPTNSPDTIMSTLVRLSDQEKRHISNHSSIMSDQRRLSNKGQSYLTEDEIAGNLFIFTAAGFDTTANTMSYAVTLLAAYPEWQTWIQSEIDTVLGHDEPLPDYETAFPKLTRCMAVMFETLRLFPPVTLLMRTNTTSQTLPPVSPSTTPLVIPAAWSFCVNTVALHTSISTWGSDAMKFNPARWLLGSDIQGSAQSLMTPPRGTFIPWSSGPRVCPGQKMSQVEFVAVVATLFRRCSASPVCKGGESLEQARRRLLDVMLDSQPVLTLQMNRPGDVCLDWVER